MNFIELKTNLDIRSICWHKIFIYVWSSFTYARFTTINATSTSYFSKQALTSSACIIKKITYWNNIIILLHFINIGGLFSNVKIIIILTCGCWIIHVNVVIFSWYWFFNKRFVKQNSIDLYVIIVLLKVIFYPQNSFDNYYVKLRYICKFF